VHAFPQLLDGARAADGTTIDSVNGGVPGYGTDNALAWLRTYGWPLQPKIVLLGFYAGNDVRDNLMGMNKTMASDEGRLVGHLASGAQMIAAGAAGLGEERRLALLHCVLCHHGPDAGARQGAGGSGRGFGSAEALALYRLNALDASVKGALEHGV